MMLVTDKHLYSAMPSEAHKNTPQSLENVSDAAERALGVHNNAVHDRN